MNIETISQSHGFQVVSRVRLEDTLVDRIQRALVEQPDRFLHEMRDLEDIISMNIQYFIQYDNLNDLARSLCQFGQRNNETILPANSTPFKYKSKNGDMVIWCKAVSSLQEFAQSIEKRVGSDYLKEILDDC